MSKPKKRRQRIDNSLTELAAGVRLSAMLTGGSTLSSYGTIGRSNNYSLITLNRIILTYLFTGNGIFQTAIQLPVEDAIRNGVNIDSAEMDANDIDQLMEWFDKQRLWDTILNYQTWTRLFGGGGIIINTNQDPETPLNKRTLRNSPIEFYDVDRWMIDDMNWDYGSRTREEVKNRDDVYRLYGANIHASRVIVGVGKKAPSYVSRQLRGWGMSEGERMIRDLNLYLKTGDVLYEILDESKIDVYKIQGLANKLATTGGTTSIQNRVMAANQIKNYVNALVLDANEDFQQKSMAFAGLAEVMRENRIGVASALRMPVTKLFGLSASGFNTGESDLENYNANVESEVRRPLKPVIKELLNIGCLKLFGFVPSYKISFPPLRVLSAKEEEEVKTSKQNRILALYDRGLVDSQEVGQALRKADLVEVEIKAEQGLLPPQPAPPAAIDPPGESTGL